MSVSRRLSFLSIFLLSLTAVATTANAQVKPGRDPNQPIDQEYTNKIREYTTATFLQLTFDRLSPGLV